MSAETTIQQSNTWETEVEILKEQLSALSEGSSLFKAGNFSFEEIDKALSEDEFKLKPQIIELLKDV